MSLLSTSYIELNKSALENNLKFLDEFTQGNVKICSVVKGNAYGHGIEYFVPLAEACGANYFATFSADEALRVKQVAHPDTRIMVMGFLREEEVQWAVSEDIEFFVFERQRLEQAIRFAEKMNKKARIHLELETGLFRSGVDVKDLPDFVDRLQEKREAVTFEGMCTHFGGAESVANYVRIKRQRIVYSKAAKWLRYERQFLPNQQHVACSAALMRYPDTWLDLVRVGILQYGFWPSLETFIEYSSQHENIRTNPLKRILSWKTQVMDIKYVPKGSYIGYGNSYLANDDMKVAVLPVGYAHGFSRSLSNQGRVLIGGQRLGVVGMVNMNACMVDVTQLENVKIGDEAVLIGRQGELELSVSSFGEFSDQVNYELLTRLPADIPRRIISE
jgi:alanine racemase